MKLAHIFIFALGLITCSLKAQQIQNFDLQLPIGYTINESLYSNIEFLDNRTAEEYDHLPIDHALFNSKLNHLVDQSVRSKVDNRTLFVQLRSLDDYYDKEKKCYATSLRINLFEHINNNYYHINGLDTTIQTQERQNLSNNISNIIYNYIAENLTATYTDNKPYTLDDIYNFDLIEKDQMPLYTNSNLKDGIYPNFIDFSKQYPLNDKMDVKIKKDELKEVKATNISTNKSIKIKPENIYAIVIEGIPYISYGRKYLPLYKENDDFWFEDQATDSNLSIVPSGGISFGNRGYRAGGIGLNFQKQSTKRKMIYKIDHLTGKAFLVSVR